LALGVLLKRYKPDIYNEVWAINNTDYQSLYYVVKKFAYYPFEENDKPTDISNKIDPRTYYYIQPFLE
jgi:hypothetical protein